MSAPKFRLRKHPQNRYLFMPQERHGPALASGGATWISLADCWLPKVDAQRVLKIAKAEQKRPRKPSQLPLFKKNAKKKPITRKADLKAEEWYSIWMRMPSGYYVLERSYTGRYVRTALWDDLKAYNRQNARQMAVFPQGVDPNDKTNPRRRNAKKKKRFRYEWKTVPQACARCGGTGIWNKGGAWSGTCFKCGGHGQQHGRQQVLVFDRNVTAVEREEIRAAEVARKEAAREKKRLKELAKRDAKLHEAASKLPERIAAFLLLPDTDPDLFASAYEKTVPSAYFDIRSYARNKGFVTAGQQKFLLSMMEREERDRRKKEKWAEETAAAAPVPLSDKRIRITGKIVSAKSKHSQYGMAHKIVVVDERGFRLYGSVPMAIVRSVKGNEDVDYSAWGDEEEQDKALDRLKGKRITFMAKVERSSDDPKFGFYSRPTKVELLPAKKNPKRKRKKARKLGAGTLVKVKIARAFHGLPARYVRGIVAKSAGEGYYLIQTADGIAAGEYPAEDLAITSLRPHTAEEWVAIRDKRNPRKRNAREVIRSILFPSHGRLELVYEKGRYHIAGRGGDYRSRKSDRLTTQAGRRARANALAAWERHLDWYRDPEGSAVANANRGLRKGHKRKRTLAMLIADNPWLAEEIEDYRAEWAGRQVEIPNPRKRNTRKKRPVLDFPSERVSPSTGKRKEGDLVVGLESGTPMAMSDIYASSIRFGTSDPYHLSLVTPDVIGYGGYKMVVVKLASKHEQGAIATSLAQKWAKEHGIAIQSRPTLSGWSASKFFIDNNPSSSTEGKRKKMHPYEYRYEVVGKTGKWPHSRYSSGGSDYKSWPHDKLREMGYISGEGVLR